MAKYVFSLSSVSSKEWQKDARYCTKYVNAVLAFFYYRSAKIKGVYRFRLKDGLTHIQFFVRTGLLLTSEILEEQWADTLMAPGIVEFSSIEHQGVMEFSDDLEKQNPFLAGEPIAKLDQLWESNNKSFKFEFKFEPKEKAKFRKPKKRIEKQKFPQRKMSQRIF